MQKWEYLRVDLRVIDTSGSDHSAMALLSDYGRGGWELVQIMDVGDWNREFYFKRPVK